MECCMAVENMDVWLDTESRSCCTNTSIPSFQKLCCFFGQQINIKRRQKLQPIQSAYYLPKLMFQKWVHTV